MGNGTRFVVSELSGRSTLALKATELGFDMDAPALTDVLQRLKHLEHRGYHFEVADGSLELLMRDAGGWVQPFFTLESFRVSVEQRHRDEITTEATVKIHVDGERAIRTAEGNDGPVNASTPPCARPSGQVPGPRPPPPDRLQGPGPRHRQGHRRGHRVALLDTTDGDRTWSTIGVSANIIEASWQALSDSIVYGLLHSGPVGVVDDHDVHDEDDDDVTDDGEGRQAMTAPQQIASSPAQQPRRGLSLPPSASWRADRPADLGPGQPVGPSLGIPGPDQGYALKLARHFDDRLVLSEGEHAADAVIGCLGVALRRASIFGRAPVIHDLEIAFTLWGFLGDAPSELVELRRPRFQAVEHHYDEQRSIAAQVPEATLRLAPTEVKARWPGEWRELLGL